MQSSILRRQSMMTMACTAVVALAYGGASRPSATILRTETALPAITGPAMTSLGVSSTRPNPGNLLGRQPLAFERNDGQLDQQVPFSARGDAYEVALGPNGARLALGAGSQVAARAGLRPSGYGRQAEIGVRFVEGRPAREMTGVQPLPGRSQRPPSTSSSARWSRAWVRPPHKSSSSGRSTGTRTASAGRQARTRSRQGSSRVHGCPGAGFGRRFNANPGAEAPAPRRRLGAGVTQPMSR